MSESIQEINSVNLLSELTQEIYSLCSLYTVNLLSEFTL